MTFWHSLALLLCWTAVVTVLGRRVVRLLPFGERPAAMLFLSPAAGLAVYVLLAELLGWTLGMRPAIVVPATVGLTLLSWVSEPRKGELSRFLLTVAVATLVVSFGLLLPIFLIRGYNVFNDTFTYLVHGQWLQTHPFRTAVHATIYDPAVTQVAIYQRMGLRMGASFFLAWVQAGSPFEWSIAVYPAVVGTALTCGALAIGGLTYQLSGVRRMSLAWGVTAGAGIGGFCFGAVAGFMPQVFGLTFATAAIVSLMPAPGRTASAPTLLRPSHALPSALLVAAAADAYSELAPLIVLALVGSVVLQVILRPGPWRTVGRNALLVGGLALVFVNAELFRMYRALSIQKGAVVGWAVPWAPADFFAHSVGLRSGSGDGERWLFPGAEHVSIALAVLLILAFAAVLARRGTRGLWSASLPVCYLLACMAGFAVFRWLVPAPWPAGLGQSWNQFKLSNWSSPVLLAMAGAAVAVLSRGRWRRMAWAVPALCLAANVTAHVVLSRERVAETIRLSGRSDDVFRSYLDMRTIVQTTPDDRPVFIDLEASEYKSRQLLAYFLQDRKVAADWTGDGYIYPSLPNGWQLLTPQDAQWWIQSRGGTEAPGAWTLRSGSFAFGRVPPFSFTRHEIVGGYGVETDASGWWTWTERSIQARLQLHAKLPTTFRLRITLLVAGRTRDLTIVARSQGRQVFAETLTLPEGWQSYHSIPFAVSAADLMVEIVASGEASPIGVSDARRVALLVKNLQLEPAGAPAP